MCDRILVFGSNPGRILSEIKVSLPQRATAWTRVSANWWKASMWR